jgi:hypothetical protein
MDWITGAGLSRVLTTVGVVVAVLLVHIGVWRPVLRRRQVLPCSSSGCWRTELEAPAPGSPVGLEVDTRRRS